MYDGLFDDSLFLANVTDRRLKYTARRVERLKISQSRSQVITKCMLTPPEQTMTPKTIFMPSWVLMLALKSTPLRSRDLLEAASIG